LAADELESAIPATTPTPTSQPSRKAGPFDFARAEKSIRITAIIGTGLSATPRASGRNCPIAWPTTVVWLLSG